MGKGTSTDVSITIAFYAFVISFGLVTNMILSFLIFTRKFMKSKYVFTASISISHILICVLVLPLAISYYITDDVNVRRACDVTVSLCVGTTTQSMLATSLRRSLAISERFRHANFTYRGKVKHIACLWIISLGLAIPYVFNGNKINLFSIFPPLSSTLIDPTTTPTINNDTIVSQRTSDVNSIVYHVNSESNNTGNQSQETDAKLDMGFFVYDFVLLFLQMVLPILVSLFLQTVTLRGIKRRPNQRHWAKEIMITKQHIAVAIVFFTFWFPGMICNIIGQHRIIEEPIYRVLHPVGFTAIVFFPLIYYKLNAHIHREFTEWLQDIANLVRPQPQEANV